jgi:hypothetical protein
MSSLRWVGVERRVKRSAFGGVFQPVVVLVHRSEGRCFRYRFFVVYEVVYDAGELMRSCADCLRIAELLKKCEDLAEKLQFVLRPESLDGSPGISRRMWIHENLS